MKQAMVYGAVLLALAGSTAAMAQNGYGDGYGGGQRGGYGGGGFGGNRDRGNAVNGRDTRRQLEAWLYTDRTEYQSGTGVRMRLTLTNLQDRMLTSTLQPSGEYGIIIRDMRSNKIVWTRSRVQNRNGNLQISPNGTLQWIEIWDQRDNAGNTLPMGTYRVEASVLGIPVAAQIFLAERGGSRPDPGSGGNGPGNGIPNDPDNGPGRPFPGRPGSGRPGPGANPVPGGTGNVQGYQGLRGSLALSRQTAKPGDALRFTYTVVNSGRETATLNFRSTQLFDAWATPVTRNPAATRTPVWRFSEGMMWGQALQTVTLEPGQSRTFTSSFRVPTQVTSGQTLDLSAAMTPSGLPSGTVGAATTRLQID